MPLKEPWRRRPIQINSSRYEQNATDTRPCLQWGRTGQAKPHERRLRAGAEAVFDPICTVAADGGRAMRDELALLGGSLTRKSPDATSAEAIHRLAEALRGGFRGKSPTQ